MDNRPEYFGNLSPASNHAAIAGAQGAPARRRKRTSSQTLANPSPISPSAQATSATLAAPHSSASSSSVPGSSRSNVPPPNKVAIPRIASADTPARSRRRSARACEPCRRRKIKCDGRRPSCSQCNSNNIRCAYEDVKRVREQKQIGSLSRRVEQYESLLRDLEGEFDASTTRRIKEALQVIVVWNLSNIVVMAACIKDGKPHAQNDEDSDSATSMGSLDTIDIVDEDLNRNENTRAAGYFGKNSEVSWIRRLETAVDSKGRPDTGVAGSFSTSQETSQPDMGSANRQRVAKEIPIAMMDYHLDDLSIPMMDPCDPFAVPPRPLADRYLDAYWTFVHPTFSAIRKPTFVDQYQKFHERVSKPPDKWLAILNMIFAIGCRYSRLTDGEDSPREDDLLFLTRARHLGLQGDVLFEHTDLQQIQLDLLVAVYLLCLGQINRASKFSGMALRSALSLGINLRLMDDRIHSASKEARYRLWWSIYYLEHLLTSMTGRASSVSESLSSVPAPVPFEEERFHQPEAQILLRDLAFREVQLQPTLFESSSQLQGGASATTYPACASLFFSCVVDLALITQAILNRVYSIEGARESTNQIEYRVQKYGQRIDRWLARLPAPYRFTIPNAGPWHLNLVQLEDPAVPFARERICLAMNYYSARITLCRPCLTQSHIASPNPLGPTRRAQFKTDMATQCLQAACALISILPMTPDVPWLARVAPWWTTLHFLMQATTALLLGLSYCSPSPTPGPFYNPGSVLASLNPSNPTATAPAPSATTSSQPPPSTVTSPYTPILQTDLCTAIAQTKTALSWIHAMAAVDPASRRAFFLCDGIVRRIAPALGVDLTDWPDAQSLPAGVFGTDTAMDIDEERRKSGGAWQWQWDGVVR
ncbi:hypothetical protein NUU61_005703 [Penicillium alfredii]|uniref:Zn(2)-C6 fungal-type domain-containing protein n=1 Tax=Penicillium alfredii TaxID=1506179 RepID=A0A9W9K8W7_9EURO|nr:uncharacterized protein NUU61_005703 [Penicillium alfredii]KAJ5096347.1 hypothetical protein NUU61_005703 [Penicillium alfredii]